jgi:hypothetical protein
MSSNNENAAVATQEQEQQALEVDGDEEAEETVLNGSKVKSVWELSMICKQLDDDSKAITVCLWCKKVFEPRRRFFH